MNRKNNRANDALRPCHFETHFTKYAEGSVLASCGDTRVLCNASIQEGTPKFLRSSQSGWLTAEYSMLPRATHTRSDREACRGKQNGRTIEIQRLIGRCLRSSIDLQRLGDFTITIDCDVIQADGGTRTTAINGAMVALVLAVRGFQYSKIIKNDPLKQMITACSLGMVDDKILLDLDYEEDSSIDVDCNICLGDDGKIIEIQGSAEGIAMRPDHLVGMLDYAKIARVQILEMMQAALGK